MSDKQEQQRGRPSLGVVPGNVTLKPYQWDWLAGEDGNGNKSAKLRRVIDWAMEFERANKGQAEFDGADDVFDGAGRVAPTHPPTRRGSLAHRPPAPVPAAHRVGVGCRRVVQGEEGDNG